MVVRSPDHSFGAIGSATSETAAIREAWGLYAPAIQVLVSSLYAPAIQGSLRSASNNGVRQPASLVHKKRRVRSQAARPAALLRPRVAVRSGRLHHQNHTGVDGESNPPSRPRATHLSPKLAPLPRGRCMQEETKGSKATSAQTFLKIFSFG